MAHTVDAVFEGGTFKPKNDAELKFSEGQQVTLTIEEPAQGPVPDLRDEFYKPTGNRETARILSDAAEHFKRLDEMRRLSSLNPGLEDKLLTMRRDDEIERPKSIKVLETINENLEFWTQGPAEIRDLIKQQFQGIVAEVRDIRPAEAKNKVQATLKTLLAYFSNISSLFIYVILIAAALKVIFLFAGQSTRLVQAFENMKYLMTPLTLFLILMCLLTMRGLHRISKFVKSYRVMSLLGCAIAIKVLIKTSIVLFTAASFREMGGAAGQLFMSALK
jgi:predicted DNA-binding antitoxin AbrB/MazE fold protein